jgi:phosphotriesterase-related protein
MTGRVMTVLGPVDPATLGTTLIHEHLLIDLRHCSFVDPPRGFEWLASARVEEVERGVLARHSCSVLDNLVLDDVRDAAHELAAFAQAGGSTIVDVTTEDIGRSPQDLRRLAESSGIAIVMGCGRYCEISYRTDPSSIKEDDLEQALVTELLDGVGSSGIRPGIVGEIGINGEEAGTGRVTGEMTSAERRVLRAAARAAKATGAPMTVHLPSRPTAISAVLHELKDVAAPLEQISLSHVDATGALIEEHEAAIDQGVWIQYDCFGMALENAWYADPGDEARCDWLAHHLKTGRINRVLVSHDVWSKSQLRSRGGGGYVHVLTSVRSALERRGFSPADIEALFVRNPASFLAWSRPH